MDIRKLSTRLVAASLSMLGASAHAGPDEAEKLWQANYAARQAYFEGVIGPLPADILKMLNMTGVWPGGGLFVIPAPKLGEGLSVDTTFGFTNPDMPTSVQRMDAEGTLARKPPAPKRPGFAGYGYEIIVVAASGQQWPLNFLQWAVNAEIGNDVGLLARVEKYQGLTVEDIQVGPDQSVNVLIAKATAPLPTGADLPAGRMEILVATTITAEEMQWSMDHGRTALQQKLQEAGVGQVSIANRPSVVQ